jgi:hypothetical protein
VTPVDHHRIAGPHRDFPVFDDILVQVEPHAAVVAFGVHAPGPALGGLHQTQRFGYRHLEHQDLPGTQRCFRDAMAGLDQGRRRGVDGDRHIRDALDEFLDVDGIDAVVGALVDDLEHIPGTDDGQGQL